MNWFKVKVSYEKLLENGLQKRVTEEFLFDALSFTEAESRAIEEMKPFISGEFTIADIARYPISELFESDGDRYYLASVAFITLDERSGREKKTIVKMLAQASDIQQAKDVVTEGMKSTMVDYVIEGLKETKILGVFKWQKATPAN